MLNMSLVEHSVTRGDLDLWPVDFKSLLDIKRQVVKVCTKFERNRAIPSWITLTFDFLTLNFYSRVRVSYVWTLYKIWAKSNNPRLSYWRFGTFSPCNFRVGAQTVLRGACRAWTQLYQTWRGRRTTIPRQKVYFGVRISCCIFKRGLLKVKWCWKRRQISHFLTPVKIRGGMGEISIPIVEALPTTEPPKYIWWPSTEWLLSAVDW